MFKSLILCTGILFACLLPAGAQELQLSVEGGLQQSWIPDYTERAEISPCPPGAGYCSYTSYADISTTYKEKPAAYLKARLSYSTSERLQLYHNLGFSMLCFQPIVVVENIQGPSTCYKRNSNDELEEVPCSTAEPIFINSEDNGKTALLYALQEIGVSYKILPRLSVQGGVDISYRLYSQLRTSEFRDTGNWPGVNEGEPNSGDDSPTFTIEQVNDRSGKGFNAILLGLHTGAAYSLTDKLSLSLGIQHSLTPLYNREEIVGKGYQKSRANQLRLGVQYRLKSW